ncbi:hypothetical protein PV04_01156 [Phialophora macrospora]|uniref:Uncharacterized protein n=1 Tax=Phialophora macrospora TaxID=1851006 RepID=A0A0D2D646_9EURO|nr:hypothetical protein PV04_01156 [Phialophora macrospora]
MCHGRQGVWSRASNQRTHQKLGDARTATPRLDRRASTPSSSSSSWGEQQQQQHQSETFFLNTFTRDLNFYWFGQSELTHSNRRSKPDRTRWPGARDETSSALDQAIDAPCVARHPKSSTDRLRLLGPSRSLADFTSELTQNDGYILQYYDEIVCATTTLLDDRRNNPFRYLISPMATRSKSVLTALLAVSASKLAYKDARFQPRALYHRQRALSEIRYAMPLVDSDRSRRLETLASVLMMCWCDISDLCRPTWTSHLLGLSGLLDLCVQHGDLVNQYQSLVSFFRQYLVYHLVMAKATFSVDHALPAAELILPTLLDAMVVQDPNPNDRWAMGDAGGADCYHGATDGHGLQRPTISFDFQPDVSSSPPPPVAILDTLNKDSYYIQPHQGFSNALLYLINMICDLPNLKERSGPGPRQDPDGVNAVVIDQVQRIETSLDTLTQLPPRPFAPESSSVCDLAETPGERVGAEDVLGNRLHLVELTAEVHRVTARLLLDTMCRLHYPWLASQLHHTHEDIIEEVLTQIEAICQIEPITSAAPIWPTFLVGCVVSGDRDRLRVLKIFDRLQTHKQQGNIPPAAAVVELVWRQQDLESDENPRKAGHVPLFRIFPVPGTTRAVVTREVQPEEKCRRTRCHDHPQHHRHYQQRHRRNNSGFGNVQSDASVRGLGSPHIEYPWERAMSMLGGFLLSLT